MRLRAVFSVLFALSFVAAVSGEDLRITKGPVVEHAGSNTAVIAWSTNASSATIVLYGTDPNNLNEKAQMPWGALTHRVTLKNLQPGTTYYFQVDSVEGSGSNGESRVNRFTTAGNGPNSASVEDHQRRHPDLKLTSGPTVEGVSDTHAVVTWSTDVPSSSIVRYGGERDRLDQTAEEPWGATTHRVELKNLRPNTRYFFTVRSAQGKDTPGQAIETPPLEFTTAGDREARR